MKDKKKIIVPLLLAGVTATGVVSNIAQAQHISVQAEESNTNTTTDTSAITQVRGANLKVSRFRTLNAKGDELNYKDTFNVGEDIYLPKVTLAENKTDEQKIVYKVTKDKSEVETHDVEVGGETVTYFKAEYQGYYDVTISLEEKGRVTTTLETMSVFVETRDATITLPTNSEYVIPAKMPKNQTGLKIPAPSVTFDEENAEGDIEEKTEHASALTAGQMRVYLVNPSNEEIDLTLDSTNTDTDKHFYAVDSSKLDKVGTYEIIYEYKDGDTVISRLESAFQVVDDYDTSAIKLKMSLQSSMPTKGNVCSDISIPKVKVVDTNVSSSDAVNAYVKVTVRNMEDASEVIEVNYEDFTFRPTKVGTYTVTYQAFINLFGTECKTSELTQGPITVTDTEGPKLIPTYDYEFDSDGEIKSVNGVVITPESGKTQREVAEEYLENRKVDVPSVVVKGEDFKIPAAYATDNQYVFSNLNDDITITRTVITPGHTRYTIQNAENPINKSYTLHFDESGSASVEYKATDKDGNTLGTVEYSITVYDSADDLKDGKTSISLSVGTSAVNESDKVLTFAKPTATDTHDKNVDVKTYLVKHEVKESEKNTEVLNKVDELTNVDDDGNYVLNITKLVKEGVSTFTIVTEAKIDSTIALSGRETTVRKMHTVKILKADDDGVAPEFSVVANNGDWNDALYNTNQDIIKKVNTNGTKISDAGYLQSGSDSNYTDLFIGEGEDKPKLSPFDQGDAVITIPTVQFKDADSKLNIYVEIKDRKGNTVSKVDTEKVTISDSVGGDGNYTYTVSEASFKLSQYGMYTVTFRASDYAGNTTIQTFGIRVNDKTAPTITVIDDDKFSENIEVGKYFEVPTATLKKDGVEVDGSTSWKIYKKSADAQYKLSGNGFVPTSEGTFYIRYYGVDEYGNESELEDSLFTVTAKDTVAPTIKLDLKQRFQTKYEWNPISSSEDYMVIEIPVAFATDPDVGQLNVVYTVTGPNSSKPEVVDHDSKGYLKTFKATSQGTYTVVYSATDKAGNTSKVEKEIKIGDTDAPTITWKNKENDLPEEIELNKTYELKIKDFLTLKDVGSDMTEDELRANVTVTLTSPEGTSVTNLKDGDGYEWKFESAGEYTLKITVKDEVGNKTTETYTIVVPSEETETKKVSPVLGTVLIVLSVVVLGGVVVYFVATNKKKPTKKAKSKKK